MCMASLKHQHALLLNLHHCRSTRTICQHPLHLFSNIHSISSISRSLERNPIQGLEVFNGDSSYFANALQAAAKSSKPKGAMAVHAHLIKLPSNGFISVWNKVLHIYGQCGQIRLSRRLFEKMPERDIISFNTMISTYIRRNKNIMEAFCVYSQMQEENVKQNHITVSLLLSACVGLAEHHLMEQIHSCTLKSGLNSNEFVGSSLVDGFAKCMRLEDATRAFDEIAQLDTISWNIMIDGWARNGNEEQAFRTFSRMRREHIGFDCFTMTSIIKTCIQPKDLERGKQLHGCILKADLALETPIGNALVTMYSKCEGMDSSTKLFQRIPAPNIISWTAMISGFTQNKLNNEAIGFYQQMLREGVKENEFSFASIVAAYSSLASLEQGQQVHARIIKSEFRSDKSVGNALIDMYAKCGSLADARIVFETMENHDLISWTVMIAGLGLNGKGREALETFEAMVKEGLKPDTITFLGCLSACSHAGLVDEGLEIFRSMINVYCVKPRREHYACMVDMLGRSGRLKEAESFIKDMGIELDPAAWEALLGACSIHGEMELGKRSAHRIMELEPEKDGPYVLLSNIYSEKGMWEEKAKVRRRLDVSGLRKETGHSWVEAGFRNLNEKAGSVGYVPET